MATDNRPLDKSNYDPEKFKQFDAGMRTIIDINLIKAAVQGCDSFHMAVYHLVMNGNSYSLIASKLGVKKPTVANATARIGMAKEPGRVYPVRGRYTNRKIEHTGEIKICTCCGLNKVAVEHGFRLLCLSCHRRNSEGGMNAADYHHFMPTRHQGRQ